MRASLALQAREKRDERGRRKEGKEREREKRGSERGRAKGKQSN